ncbi:hypothetical protein AAFF_G00375040 [Aldrovandia affinis]|uniref:Uncharacterized protein n=1 Tax=Aldrovandia affinis TaxID=143900 RepID=A0AAD7WM82_9TELE|nr:hypothetical protein AAFF_G00375040 [Aldrovandia affinis]
MSGLNRNIIKPDSPNLAVKGSVEAACQGARGVEVCGFSGGVNLTQKPRGASRSRSHLHVTQRYNAPE